MCPLLAWLQKWWNPSLAFTKGSIFQCGHLPVLALVFVFLYFSTHQPGMQANLRIQTQVLNLVRKLDLPCQAVLVKQNGEGSSNKNPSRIPSLGPFLPLSSGSPEPSSSIKVALIKKHEKNTRQEPALRNLATACTAHAFHILKRESMHFFLLQKYKQKVSQLDVDRFDADTKRWLHMDQNKFCHSSH